MYTVAKIPLCSFRHSRGFFKRDNKTDMERLNFLFAGRIARISMPFHVFFRIHAI